MVQTEGITNALTKFDFAVAKTINSTEIDYFVDYFEPTEVYAYTVESFPKLDPTILNLENRPTAGILVAYIENEDTVYACGAGTYDEIHGIAFEPIDEYF